MDSGENLNREFIYGRKLVLPEQSQSVGLESTDLQRCGLAPAQAVKISHCSTSTLSVVVSRDPAKSRSGIFYDRVVELYALSTGRAVGVTVKDRQGGTGETFTRLPTGVLSGF